MALGQRDRLIEETFRRDGKELGFVSCAVLIEQSGIADFRYPNEALIFVGHHIEPALGLCFIFQWRRAIDDGRRGNRSGGRIRGKPGCGLAQADGPLSRPPPKTGLQARDNGPRPAARYSHRRLRSL